jgi:hypothetical protein
MKALVLAMAVLAAACAPSPLSQVDIQGVATASPSPSPSPGPSGSGVASPAPAPTMSVLALGEAYLVVADRYNHAREFLLVAPATRWGLADFRSWCAEFQRVTDAFVAGMTKIPFTSAAMKKDAAALIKESKLEIQAFKRCTAAKSIATVKKSAATVDRLTPSGTAASQRLRLDLGLPTR